jgi:hypothetical protein
LFLVSFVSSFLSLLVSSYQFSAIATGKMAAFKLSPMSAAVLMALLGDDKNKPASSDGPTPASAKTGNVHPSGCDCAAGTQHPGVLLKKAKVPAHKATLDQRIALVADALQVVVLNKDSLMGTYFRNEDEHAYLVADLRKWLGALQELSAACPNDPAGIELLVRKYWDSPSMTKVRDARALRPCAYVRMAFRAAVQRKLFDGMVARLVQDKIEEATTGVKKANEAHAPKPTTEDDPEGIGKGLFGDDDDLPDLMETAKDDDGHLSEKESY